MSNLRLINDALSLIGVLPEAQDASAEQGALGLAIATDLVDEWSDDGIVLSWEPNPTLDGDCSLVGTERNALMYGIAVRMCPHFGRETSPTLAVLAGSAVQKLIRTQLNRSMEPSDAVLPGAEANYQGFDITTGWS